MHRKRNPGRSQRVPRRDQDAEIRRKTSSRGEHHRMLHTSAAILRDPRIRRKGRPFGSFEEIARHLHEEIEFFRVRTRVRCMIIGSR